MYQETEIDLDVRRETDDDDRLCKGIFRALILGACETDEQARAAAKAAGIHFGDSRRGENSSTRRSGRRWKKPGPADVYLRYHPKGCPRLAKRNWGE